MMTRTIYLILLQSDLKEHIKREFEFKNTGNRTHIITKAMADYSAMKSYLEKNNLHYFTFFPNSEKPIEAAIRQLPPDKQAEDIATAFRT
jgi:hypothetical protein